ncbi:MAG: hypothetical protein JKY56_11195, partial [Kofleriaceae bacterium]|nr:hypothetical protein [Kofleriaceae bacterium]
PSENKTGVGTSFFIYAPATSGADNDVNIYSYEDDTTVSVVDVTISPLTSGGKTSIDLASGTNILTRVLQKGEDLNVRNNLGLDILDPGHTYWIRATNPVTVQYGHLGQVTGGNQARDGGGFVPSSNGTSIGHLFFFAIPHNPGNASEKELRVVCYDDNTTVALYGANSFDNTWTSISSSVVDADGHVDFVGASDSTFRDLELYKLTISPAHHRCTVFEANWMETGSVGTSDYASAMASANGLNTGYLFTAYMGPPGHQNRISHLGDSYSHLYISTHEADTQVTVTDLDTGGTLMSETVLLGADTYHDFKIDSSTYNAMNTGGRRPYLRVNASKPVTVLGTNHNDNWMAYFYSVLPPDPTLSSSLSSAELACGGQTVLSLSCGNTGSTTLEALTVSTALPEGVTYVASSATGALGEPATTSNPDGTQTLLWTTSSLAPSETQTLSFNVALDCASVAGCLPDQLVAMTTECSGTASSDIYSAVSSANLMLRAGDNHVVDNFSVQDVTGNGDITSEFVVRAEDGSASYRVTRATDPDGIATMLTTLASLGPSGSPVVYSYLDTTASPGTTYFYRIVADDGCLHEYGPLAIASASGASSGSNSGLESNGRLSSQLAQRAIARVKNPLWLYPPNESIAILWSGGVTLAELLPDVGPADSRPVNVTPSDLTVLTNAVDVFAADYVDLAGGLVASVLVVETEGALYEHSKAICDRAGGAQLDVLDYGRLYDGQLVRSSFFDRDLRTRDWAVEFKLYETSDGFALHSGWLDHDYPQPESGQRVLNVQIWSAQTGFELTLAEDVLDGLEPSWATPSTLPEAYFESSAVLGSVVYTSVKRRPENTENLWLRTTRVLEDGTSTFDLEALGSLQGAHATRFEPFLDATLELIGDDGTVLDRTWGSDGAWTVVDDSMWGGASRVLSFTDIDCHSISAQASPADTESLQLAGCGALTADVAEFAGVARHLAGGLAPLDLSDTPYMRFWMQSDVALNVCAEMHSRDASEPPCVRVAAQPEGNYVAVPLKSFRVESSCEDVALEDVHLFTFTTHQAGVATIEVSQLSFGFEADAQEFSDLESCDVVDAAPRGCGCTGTPGETPNTEWILLVALALLINSRRRQKWKQHK